ncbi:MAG: hypothetical protein IC227_05180 [Enterococcus lacertideformus]|uniref:Uncharacterized protein n=1 Tax=Enterococcus lacertideformus TaxID=2771493 RepID=A0A931AYS7_9ENTE|nr:hypothetical protein [Enterococcus lacertideformus]
MRIDKMITTFLQTTDLFNGSTFLGNQSQDQSQDQETRLGNRLNLENSGVVTQSSDETHSRNEQHENHREGRSAHQSSKTLDRMQDNDPRHPFSAYIPKKSHESESLSSYTYIGRFKNNESLHKEINDRIKQKIIAFNKLKAEISTEVDQSQTNLDLQQAQKFCEEFDGLKSELLNNQSNMRKQRKSIRETMKKGMGNEEKLKRFYFKKYNGLITATKTDKKFINSLISDCQQTVNNLQESIKSKFSNLDNTTTIGSPKVSIEEGFMLVRYTDLSGKFNRVTKEINKSYKKVNNLQKNLSQNEDPCNIVNIKADIANIISNIIPQLKRERENIRCEMTKEKNSIELLVKQGKLISSEAKLYVDEYNSLINNTGNRRNKRDVIKKQTLSEKLASVNINNKERKIRESF